MSHEFTTFANLCIAANSGIRSFDFVNEWLLQNSGNEDLLLSEGPIDFLLKFKAPIEVLQTLINLQPKITSKKFSSGRMALHIAACSSVTVDVIEYIFDQNTHAINKRDSQGNTPLHCAVLYYAPVHVINFMVSNIRPGRHRNHMLTTNQSWWTPLHIACYCNPGVILLTPQVFYCRDILEKSDNNGNLPLHLACFNRNATSDLINELIMLYPLALQKTNDEGNLPLHMACAGKAKEEVIRKLLEENSNAASQKNLAGELPLHVACKNNVPPHIILCLLSFFPDAAKEKDDGGNLPIHLECQHHIDLLSLEKLEALLKEHPISLYLHNNDGKVPSCLFQRDLGDEIISYAKMAITAGYSAHLVALLLVDFQTEAPFWRDENGNCLLHHACNKSGAEISCQTIALLLKLFPESPKIVNNSGQTPKDLLQEAASYKDSAGRLLLHRFAKLKASYYAFCEFNVTADVINFVADAYPDSISVPDYNGMLPLHHACLNHCNCEINWNCEDVLFTLLKRYPDSLVVPPTMVCVVGDSKRMKLG